jgi:beta-xylosidase
LNLFRLPLYVPRSLLLLALFLPLGQETSAAPALEAPPRPKEAVAAGCYQNPVYHYDFPDPHVISHDGRYYATHGRGFGFQVLESGDLVNWTHRGTAFEVPWSKEHYWAPEVIKHRGQFYMTYSALHPETRRHDIGIATSPSPLGPFTHRAILVRAGEVRVGVIDTNVFRDRDGTFYLLYSEEEPRRIVMRKMAPDLMSVDSTVIELMRPDRPEERGVVEAPTLIRHNGKYHLFYSTGWFQSNIPDASYAVYRAVSRTVNGPYVKDAKPLLASVPGQVYGPGHQSIVRLPSGEWWIAYHGWDAQNEPRYGSNPIGRSLRIDRLRWKGDTPVMEGPTVTPRPAPRESRRSRRVESCVER